MSPLQAQDRARQTWPLWTGKGWLWPGPGGLSGQRVIPLAYLWSGAGQK